MIKIRFKKITFCSIRSILLALLYLYPLVVRRKWKLISGIEINSVGVSNEIYIYPIIFMLMMFLHATSKKSNKLTKNTVSKSYFYLLACGLLILIVGVLLNANASMEQSLYASLVIMINIIALSAFISCNLNCLVKFIRLIIFSTVIYSVLQIYLSFNMDTVAMLLGNSIQSKMYINENQFRGKLPLGYPTTVVFYFALSIPFIYLERSRAKTKIQKWALIILSFLVLLAALMTGSRGGAALTGFMIIWSVYCLRKRGKTARAVAITLAIVMGLVFASNYVDLSRIFTRFNDSSTSARLDALISSFELASANPVFGTGTARYYHRVYDNRFIYINGHSTLIDPHNAYALLLSEIGVIGFIAFIILFVNVIKPITKIKNPTWKLAAQQLLFVFAIYSVIGSQVINEISISLIAWMYLGLFLRYSTLEKKYAKFTANRIMIARNKFETMQTKG